MFLSFFILLLLSPAVSISLLPVLIYGDRRNSAFYAIAIGVVFAVAGFTFQPAPGSTNDLVRYLAYVEGMGSKTVNDVFTIRDSGDLMIVSNLLFLLSNRLGSPHLLPAISMFVVYSSMAYITTDLGKRQGVRWGKVCLVLLFTICVLPFPAVVSNIRNVMAFSISLLAAYRDTVQKKRNLLTISMYVVPMFIHISSLAIVGLRFLLVFQGVKRAFIGVAMILLTGSSFVPELMLRVLPERVYLTRHFLLKAVNYLNTSDSAYIQYLQGSTFARLQRLYFVLIALFFLIVECYRSCRNTGTTSKIRAEGRTSVGVKDFRALFFFLCCAVVGSSTIKLTVYGRFAWAAIITSPAYLYDLASKGAHYQGRYLLMGVLLLIGLAGVIHQVLLFTLSADVYSSVSGFITSSVMTFFR